MRATAGASASSSTSPLDVTLELKSVKETKKKMKLSNIANRLQPSRSSPSVGGSQGMGASRISRDKYEFYDHKSRNDYYSLQQLFFGWQLLRKDFQTIKFNISRKFSSSSWTNSFFYYFPPPAPPPGRISCGFEWVSPSAEGKSGRVEP